MIELLTAHLFAQPHPYQEPHSGVCGLLRYLHLLSTWDWDLAPLVLDVNGELTEEDHSQIMRTFESQVSMC